MNINKARCPKCGDKVFVPNKTIRETFGGDNNDNDPQVWCIDHGHWIGFLSECVDDANEGQLKMKPYKSITVEKLTDINLVREALSFCYGIDSKMTLEKLYFQGHTPIRLQLFKVFLEGIPTKVSVHLVRHSQVGQFHLVGSNRADWNKAEDKEEWDKKVNRLTPVNHFMLLNAQHLVEMSHKRLCSKAEEYTIQIWRAIKEKVREVDPKLARYMVTSCEYRNGICTEPNSCGLYKRWL